MAFCGDSDYVLAVCVDGDEDVLISTMWVKGSNYNESHFLPRYRGVVCHPCHVHRGGHHFCIRCSVEFFEWSWQLVSAEVNPVALVEVLEYPGGLARFYNNVPTGGVEFFALSA